MPSSVPPVDVKILKDNVLPEHPRPDHFAQVLYLVVDESSRRDADYPKSVPDWQHGQVLELTNGVELFQGVLLRLWSQKRKPVTTLQD